MQWTLVVGPLALLALAYLLSDGFRAEARKAADLLAQGDMEGLRDYIRSFGAWAPIASLFLMVFQALAAPIPGFVVVFANGLSFGLFWGWVLSLIGQVLAAAVCFWLARSLGRGPVSGMVGRLGLESADHWFGRWGAHAVLVTRMVPGMAFDAVSYAAGLTRMRFARFLVATALGTAPSTLLYVYLGQTAPQFGWALLAATGLVSGAAVASIFVRGRRAAPPPAPQSWGKTTDGGASSSFVSPQRWGVGGAASLLRWPRTVVGAAARTMEASGWVRLTLFSLIGLLAYLLIGQIFEPGFTDYWGYLLVQITAIAIIVVWLSHAIGGGGGFSWLTYLVVVGAVYVDTFGNAAGLYERYEAYDKFVHAGGTAALAAASYDILAALHRRGTLAWPDRRRAIAAISAAMLLASAWEVYEFTADQLFETYRHAGLLDTLYDLVSDLAGAMAMSLLLWRRETVRRFERVSPARQSLPGRVTSAEK